ncbi:MAG TPA: hypothetical protein VI381_02930 [Allosphingosinicella sp.]
MTKIKAAPPPPRQKGREGEDRMTHDKGEEEDGGIAILRSRCT